MCENISYGPAYRNRSRYLAKIRCILMLVNRTVFMAEYFQPQVDCTYSQNAICEGV
jgi:hypothetical protein